MKTFKKFISVNRRFLNIAAWFISYTSLSQNPVKDQLATPRVITDCESISLNAADMIVKKFNDRELNAVEEITREWIYKCGDSEIAHRIIILKAVFLDELKPEQLQQYFKNDFHFVLKNRIDDSRRTDFGYAFTSHKTYYGYVPLRHSIDSLTKATAKLLLREGDLTPEQELVCKLFSWDVDAFTQALDEKLYDSTYIKSTMKRQLRDDHNKWLSASLYSGIYSSIGTDLIFAPRATIGIMLSSPFENKFIYELGFKIRINQNDQSFKFYALGDTNTVNSDMSVFLGGTIGYKLLERKNIVLIPKAGVGLESVSTGISEKKKNSNDVETYDVDTWHFTTSIAIMKPVFKVRYIGFEVAYHYCTYNMVDNLFTKFNSHSWSGEIFYRF